MCRNKFPFLIFSLKKKGLIPNGTKVKEVMIDKDFINVKANIKKDCFFAGDRIILIISEDRTKAISKRKGKKRQIGRAHV